MTGFFDLIRPGVFKMDSETAHGLAVKALKTGLVPGCAAKADPKLTVNVAGISFPNPVGMAAGFDKNAEIPDALLSLGFGFAEVGTLTPKPQAGNPKPRLFRLPADRAVINRMGFNNDGHAAALARLAARKGKPGIVGVNIGANKDSEDRVGDYVQGIHRFYEVATYFTVNISSPNTPGLRDLQARDSLKTLLDAVLAARAEEVAKSGRRLPIFLKIAPDLTPEGLDDIAAEVAEHDLDGLIISNTTLSREGLVEKELAAQAGGMSGKPLFERSTAVLAAMRKRVGPALPIIGAGGVGNAADVVEKIKAGADLVQIYSMMIYEGPGIAAAIVKDLPGLLAREGVTTISALRDRSVDAWAVKF